MRRFLLFVLALCLLGILLSGCAHGKAMSRGESFSHWTRYYEIRMGLVESRIHIAETPNDKCAEVWMEPEIHREMVFVVATYYNPEKEGCRAPWDTALHEACHRRYMHHLIGYQLQERGHDIEAEAKTCERRYKR